MNASIGKILFNGRKNVLWGAGKNGTDLLFSLIEKGVNVAYFCDADTDKQFLRIYNKTVIPPQEVLDDPDGYNIIVTPMEEQQQKEIIDILESGGIKEYVLGEEIGISVPDVCVNREYLYNMIRDAYTHKIIIYGTDYRAIKIAEMLGALDVEIEYIVDEIDEEYQLKRLNLDVKPLHRVLDLEDGIYKVVIPSAYDKKKINKLDELGLRVRQDYNFADDYRMMLPRSSILDPNLGYNFCVKNSKIPGFVRFGEEDGYKIVTLGNSTTDAARFSFKSWSEILYEKLKTAGLKVCVLCGGCIGYRTSQELVKLIRDVLPMKPYMVIDYSGYNDALISGTMSVHPFVHGYQIELFNKIAKIDECEKYGEQYTEKINYPVFGMESNLTSWEQYINNIKAMKGICDIFGIRFRGFLQPWLATKPTYSMQEREMIANSLSIFGNKYFHNFLDFYANRSSMDLAYMTDLTQIFDQYGEVYIDQVHVNEMGNTIIADNIANVIMEGLV